ncbi:hypothetical protein CYMTET_37066 [Cymbomonas tetramitiformis]|uniref:Protein kinase domain-containing protein n=1 Tax=Cymbomonas tetramitiformis TaxID=36881 RepID=A0AAE0F6E3_9CHLO|nr:hypothetical protein CYMTET_37066 [Cymbomonas tetramitiformis]
MERRVVNPSAVVRHWFGKSDEQPHDIATRILDHRSHRLEGTDGGHVGVSRYTGRIFPVMNFEHVSTFTENDDQMQGVYFGFHTSARRRMRAVLKVRGLKVEKLLGMRTIQHMKSEVSKPVNECLWYQQLCDEFSSENVLIIPRLLDVCVVRQPKPSKAQGKEICFVCMVVEQHDLTLHDWLSSAKVSETTRRRCAAAEQTSTSRLPLLSGAGFLLLEEGGERGVAVNLALRQIILYVICYLCVLQRKRCFLHHDLHTRNVLLRSDKNDQIVPVLMDLENAEGFFRREGSEKMVHVPSAHSYSFVNGLTFSYDCFRLFSDLLFMLGHQRLLHKVDATTVRLLRQCVSGHFDETAAQRDYSHCAWRFEQRMWQPHILSSSCDPSELLRWDARVVAELEIAITRSEESMLFLGASGDECGARRAKDAVQVMEGRCLRAFFCLGAPRGWSTMACKHDLFLDERFLETITDHAGLCDTLHGLVHCMVYHWNDMRVGQSWTWQLGEAATPPGAYFARLHMLQSVMLCFLRWIFERTIGAASVREEAGTLGATGRFWRCAEECARRRVPVHEQQRVIAFFLSAVAPHEYTLVYLRSVDHQSRVSDFYDVQHIGDTSLERIAESGLVRCLPVPCIDLPVSLRYDVSTVDHLYRLAKISTDPRIYMAKNAGSFLGLALETSAQCKESCDHTGRHRKRQRIQAECRKAL